MTGGTLGAKSWLGWLSAANFVAGVGLGLLQPTVGVAVGGFGVVAGPTPMGLLFLAAIAAGLVAGLVAGVRAIRARAIGTTVSVAAVSLSLAFGLLVGNMVAGTLHVGFAASRPDPTPKPPTGAGWAPAGSMQTPRYDHTATLLSTGRVLVAGGEGARGSALASCELFDPATGTWAPTGDMVMASREHVASLLRDGRVLLISLMGEGVELYDPTSARWSTAAQLLTPRTSFAVTVLLDGRVLVTGGQATESTDVGALASAEVFDPATETWDTVEPMRGARWDHAATLLADGRVLVTGGRRSSTAGSAPALASAELFDPQTGAWSEATSMAGPRARHVALLLDDGTVLVASGGDLLSEVPDERFDPATGTWQPTGATAPFAVRAAVRLSDGRVLLIGGLLETRIWTYDPQDWLAAPTAVDSQHKAGAATTLLQDGRLLVSGGNLFGTVEAFAAAQLYAP